MLHYLRWTSSLIFNNTRELYIFKLRRKIFLEPFEPNLHSFRIERDSSS